MQALSYMLFRTPKIINFCVICILAGSAYGQSGNWQLSNFNIEDGLPNNNVISINQDSLEYIWIGTENGLSRFNGIEFHNYQNIIGDTFSLPGNYVFRLSLDSKKRLFIGTSGGLCNYDARYDRFIRIAPLSGKAVRDIIEDNKGNIWVATEGNGLFKFSNDLKLIEQINKTEDENYLWKLFADDDNIWIGTLEGKLIKYESKSGKYSIIEEYGRNNGYISYIGKDNAGNLIVFADETGIAKLIPIEKAHYRIVRYPDLDYFKFNILKMPDGVFWLSHSNGITVFDPAKETFVNLQDSKGYEGLELQSGSPAVFIDKQNNIWMGRINNGLTLISNTYKQFNHYLNTEFQSSIVFNIMENLDQQLVAATFIGGIMVKDKENNAFTSTRKFNVFNESRIEANTVFKIFQYQKNKYFIATYRGLIVYDAYTEKSEYYYTRDGRKNTLNNNHVQDILQVNSNTYWLATNGGGINVFNTKTGKFSYIVQKNEQQPGSGLINNYCISLMKDHTGKIWIGTYNGLSCYDPLTNSFQTFLPDPHDANSLSNNWIYCIYEDTKYNIWIGTYNGLNLYNPEGNKFRHFDMKDGLANNVINAITEDNKKNLWISTGKGISKLSINDYSCKSYNKDDGLKILQFARGSIHKNKEGIIFMGGKGGILYFNPDQINQNPFLPTVRITGLKIFNKPVSPLSHPDILPQEIVTLNMIKIPHKQNVITFDFIAFNYINPQRNNYEYMLEGFDMTWQQIDNKHEVTYTNLDPGDYIFRVRASNNDGTWSTRGTRLRVIILPPWWRTIIFEIFSILFIAGVSVWFYSYKVKSLRKHKDHLENLVRIRTREIEDKNEKLIQQTQTLNATNVLLEDRQQYIESQAKELLENSENLKQINELLVEKQKMVTLQAENLKVTNHQLTILNATKDKFFSIIAHDLKNPFNSLLGFSEMLSSDFWNLTDEKRRQIAEVIHISSLRIYSLLENLLQWAGSQTGNISYNPEVLALEEVINTNFELIKNFFEEKGNSFIQKIPEHTVVFADRNMLNTIFRNLLGNAVKFTENGTITIEVKMHDQFQEVTIQDTGVGIPEEKLIRIFEIDKVRSTGGTRGEKGSGLGLIICREFVQRNGGEITVKSHVGKGTTFTFTIPCS
jgi:signal transduction histidine kinase/ligand-binding sensor domain-containing protein